MNVSPPSSGYKDPRAGNQRELVASLHKLVPRSRIFLQFPHFTSTATHFYLITILTIRVAVRPRARNVFACSDTLVGSNPTRGMDICLRFFLFVLSCVGSGRATGCLPFKESCRLSISSIISE
jgi:hypothetical protein